MKIFIFFITNIKYHRRQESWNENKIETLPLCHYYHVYVLLLNIKGKMQKLAKQCVTKTNNVVVFWECLGKNRTFRFTKPYNFGLHLFHLSRLRNDYIKNFWRLTMMILIFTQAELLSVSTQAEKFR